MRGLKKLSIGILVAFCCGTIPLLAQSPSSKWEPVKTTAHNLKSVLKQSDIEVFSSPSVITITVNQPVNIKIFTILGKLISSQNVEPGVYEYRLPSHGVYIIKTSDSTCKVAI